MAWGVYDYPEPRETAPLPVCPVCGKICSRIYYDTWRNLVGCDECIDFTDAENEPDCFPEGGVI